MFIKNTKILSLKRILIILLVITSIYFLLMFVQKYPVVYAAGQTPSGHVFSGQASWFDPWDVNLYASIIKSGQKNGFLLSNLYTTDKDGPIFIYPLYTIIGSLFKHVEVFILFHLLSFVTTFILCLGVFGAAYLILKNAYYSMIVLVFVVFGRGLGWIVDLSVKSADLWITSFTIRSAIQRPHEGLGTILYILSMIFFVKFIETRRGVYNSLSLIALFLLVFFYPYYLPIYFCVFACCLFFWKTPNANVLWMSLFRNSVLIGLLTLAYFTYLYNSGFMAAISEDLPKVSLRSIILGYGLLSLVLAYSIFVSNRDSIFRSFLTIWVLICIAASYLPLGFSRFYLRGLFFPLALLFVLLLRELIISKKYRYVAIILSILFLLSSVFTIMYVYRLRINASHQMNFWYYLPQNYKKAFDFIQELPGDGVLAQPDLMNYIPAHTGKKTFVGHKLQTPLFNHKIAKVRYFYSGQLPRDQAVDFLIRNNISYVIYGYYEQRAGFVDPTYLRTIYNFDGVKIYYIK